MTYVFYRIRPEDIVTFSTEYVISIVKKKLLSKELYSKLIYIENNYWHVNSCTKSVYCLWRKQHSADEQR